MSTHILVHSLSYLFHILHLDERIVDECSNSLSRYRNLSIELMKILAAVCIHLHIYLFARVLPLFTRYPQSLLPIGQRNNYSG